MDSYVGEIRLFAGTYAPLEWLFCEGQVLPTNQYQALYAVLGNTYGGNASQGTFALPDLRGRAPMGSGTGTGLTARNLNDAPGSVTVTLTSAQMPSHTHTVKGKVPTPTSMSADPQNNAWTNVARSTPIYTNNAPNTALDQKAVSAFPGGGLPHDNVQPCVGINYIISLYGTFPPSD
ncbi:MAG TPA: tail fiber protein [Methylomusa anaerophila]|uniref:Phage Tail Collar Domain protein n=1 Tax=Methylomusa anaerophila TaxID=1930071 RepID=A0A348AH31_9FIRM|nr:tail fiber protein [Methylomusa anaerophila]BBB90379.1 phage Tail Collar Domain protein [Methylomusa anaerophila]HML89274.1 tail fiber protein [Methylomusa anaerophila]